MPSQVPQDNTCLDRIFNDLQDPFGLWIEGEGKLETPLIEVLRSITGFSAYMAADLLRQSVKGEIPYDLIATLNLWFLDSLRIGLGVNNPDGRNITLGRGNGNGAHSDSS